MYQHPLLTYHNAITIKYPIIINYTQFNNLNYRLLYQKLGGFIEAFFEGNIGQYI